MSTNFIDYGKLIDDAMHVIVRQALGYVKNGSLPGKHHFFISFLTSYPGVKISDSLKARYPDEMTIVIQHQFEDLKVTEKNFSVVLSFDNVKENIVIPFDSLVAFADPSVKFGLQFSHANDRANEDEVENSTAKAPTGNSEEEKKSTKAGKKGKGKSEKGPDSKNNNVVDIEAFRKK